MKPEDGDEWHESVFELEPNRLGFESNQRRSHGFWLGPKSEGMDQGQAIEYSTTGPCRPSCVENSRWVLAIQVTRSNN